MKRMSPIFILCQIMVLCLVSLTLSGCLGQSLLSEVVVEPPVLHPSGHGETVTIRYRIGQNAMVTVLIEDEDGQQYVLRNSEPRSASNETYVLRFDGTVPTDEPQIERQLLPSGEYMVIVQAMASHGQMYEERHPIQIVGDVVPMPAIENVVVFPEVISPNADAIDDVTEITYRLAVTATVDIDITTPEGNIIPLVAREAQEPAEWRHIWNGKHPDGSLLANGVYTYTIRAEDDYGNLVVHQGTIELVDVGQPEATILAAYIAPQRLMLGDVLTITVRVKNTGTVPIRTYGPPSGHTYTTDEVYSSIADGRYTAEAGGFWRVGADWDANAGGGPRRYPFRWALSDRSPDQWAIPDREDWLAPGEVVDIVGHVVIVQRETKMGFYVGLIQDGVGFFQDRTARTIIEVGF